MFYKKMLEDITFEQLTEFTCDMLESLKIYDYNLFQKYEMKLYAEMYGMHFTKWLLEKALEKMENEDGTKGGHWNIEQTNAFAKQYGIVFKNYNEYDFNYVMNMMYSDYYGSVPNETSIYAKMAKKFLEDKDVKLGKAYKYYISIC